MINNLEYDTKSSKVWSSSLYLRD